MTMDNAQVTEADRKAAADLINTFPLSLGWADRDDLPTQLVEAFARHRLERSEPVGWMGIDSAPVNTPVRIKAGNMTFLARLVPDASMSDLDTACDQWQAEIEGEHPPCWSGGACWASNEDGVTSLQPTAWRYPGGTPEPVAEIERLRSALRWYADQMCEGLCQGKDPKACAAIGADNCAGCPAVIALRGAS